MACGAIADEQHRGAFALGGEEAVLDGRRGKLEGLLDAHGHLVGLGARVAQAALGEHGVGALAEDHHLAGDLVLAGAHADDAARLILDKLLDRDAVDRLGAGLLGLLGQPLVEGAAQHAVAVGALDRELGAREVDGHRGLVVHQRDALMRDLALEGRFLLEVGEDLLERMGVDAPTRHVLGAGVVAALDHEDAFAGRRRHIRGDRAGAARAHHDDVEIRFGHHRSFPADVYVVLIGERIAPRKTRSLNEKESARVSPVPRIAGIARAPRTLVRKLSGSPRSGVPEKAAASARSFVRQDKASQRLTEPRPARGWRSSDRRRSPGRTA